MTQAAVLRAPFETLAPGCANRCREAAPESCAARHYAIGPVDLTLRTELRFVADAFRRQYAEYEVRMPAPGAFHIDVIRRRSWRSLRTWYHVYGNGEEHFVVRHPRSVLPHVEWAINLMIARHLPWYLQLHASVVSKEGRGVMFPGSPGQGKSTLAAALLTRGWQYYSDEFALIDPQTRELNAYPKALCIKKGSFDLLERFGLPLDAGPAHLKGLKGPVRFIHPRAVRPDAVAEPGPIRVIIFPHQSPGVEPAVQPMPRAQALFELTKVSFNFSKFKARGFHLLADVVEQAQCYRLISGDLNRTCEVVESCVDHVFGGRA